MGGGESDGEGGSVEGDVGDDDGRVGGRAGGLWWAERERLRLDRSASVWTAAASARTSAGVDFTTTSLRRSDGGEGG